MPSKVFAVADLLPPSRRGFAVTDATPASMEFDDAESAAVHRERNLREHAKKVSPRFRNATTARPEVLAWVRRHLADRGTGESLLLLGRTGTGKTHAAYAALRLLAEAGLPNLSWLAVSEADLLREARQSDGVGDRAVSRYAAAPILLIDDLGTAKRTEFTVETLRAIVDHRYNNRLPLIITTNLELQATEDSPLDILGAVGARTASRLAEMAPAPIHFAGQDRRYGGAA